MSTDSAIVGYRSAVVAAIEAAVPGLNKVDWYDAAFDEDDVQEWTLETPCAFVAVRDTKGLMHSTGEINLALDMVVVVVTADVANRDGDAQNWGFLEQIITLVDYNYFGVANAAVPDNLAMARLREPALRKMGVALGLVEWTAGLTIGKNQILSSYYYTNPETGQMIEQAPTTAVVGTTALTFGSATSTETVTLTP